MECHCHLIPFVIEMSQNSRQLSACVRWSLLESNHYQHIHFHNGLASTTCTSIHDGRVQSHWLLLFSASKQQAIRYNNQYGLSQLSWWRYQIPFRVMGRGWIVDGLCVWILKWFPISLMVATYCYTLIGFCKVSDHAIIGMRKSNTTDSDPPPQYTEHCSA